MGAGCAHCDLAAVRICDDANEWSPYTLAERREDYEAMRGLQQKYLPEVPGGVGPSFDAGLRPTGQDDVDLA